MYISIICILIHLNFFFQLFFFYTFFLIWSNCKMCLCLLYALEMLYFVRVLSSKVPIPWPLSFGLTELQGSLGFGLSLLSLYPPSLCACGPLCWKPAFSHVYILLTTPTCSHSSFSISLSLCLSIYIFIFLFIYLSISLSIFLTFYLFILPIAFAQVGKSYSP